MIPWREVSAAIGKMFTLTQEMQANNADIKHLSEKVDGLSKEVQSLNKKLLTWRLLCSEPATKISGRKMIFGICARTMSAGTKMRPRARKSRSASGKSATSG